MSSALEMSGARVLLAPERPKLQVLPAVTQVVAFQKDLKRP